MPELDPELVRAVAALSRHRAPPGDAKARVYARIEAVLVGPEPLGGDGDGTGGGSTGGAGAVGGGAGAKLFAVKVVAATTALTVAGLLALKLGALAVAPSPSAATRSDAGIEDADDRPATSASLPEAPVAIGPELPEPPTEPPAEPAQPAEPFVASSESAPVKAPEPAPKQVQLDLHSDIQAELALIDAARRAGSADASITALREHARRFPTGTLADEREALWAIASCAREDHADAAKRRDAILARRPNSPLLDRIAKACPTLGAPAEK